MILNIVVWLAFVLAAVFFGWLVTRAWKSRRWFVKWPGAVLSGLLALVMALIGILGALSLVKVYGVTRQPAPQIQASITPENIARGEHIADVFCVECHSPTGTQPMVGGRDMGPDIPFPIGKLISANLTPAGPLKNWTDGEIMRTLREGIDNKGRRLLVMQGINVRYLSDDDLKALIAYLRSLEPARANEPAVFDQINFLGVLLFGSGMVPELPPVTEPIVAPPKAASVEYGKYILSYQDCTVCHGIELAGGDGTFAPAGPPLSPVKGWTQDQFLTAMRTGITPSGREMQPPMPWKAIGRMDDVELQALYLYLKSLW